MHRPTVDPHPAQLYEYLLPLRRYAKVTQFYSENRPCEFSECSVSEVFVRDVAFVSSFLELRLLLKEELSAYVGLEFQKIELETVKGMSLYMCDPDAWLQVQLERQSVLNLRHREVFDVDGEHAVDEPQTANAQRQLERLFEGGLASDEDIIGVLMSLDGTWLVKDGRATCCPGYFLPEALTLSARRDPFSWMPAFFFPIFKHSGTTQERKLDRELKREALRHLVASFDGERRVHWRHKATGTIRRAIFAMMVRTARTHTRLLPTAVTCTTLLCSEHGC